MERETPEAGTCKSKNRLLPASRRPRCPYSRVADRYGLQPRTIIRRLLQDRRPREASHRPIGKKLPPHGLSRHRKRLASARDRCHEREIDQAFENLRQVLPAADGCCRGDASAEAKMTTLKMALRYIDALSRLLQQDDDVLPSPYDATHTPSDDQKPRSVTPDDLGTKTLPPENDDGPPEETYILALAKIFEESNDSSETNSSGGDKNDISCPSDAEDVQSNREDFSDLSDHDFEGRLDVLANLGNLSGSEALVLSPS